MHLWTKSFQFILVLFLLLFPVYGCGTKLEPNPEKVTNDKSDSSDTGTEIKDSETDTATETDIDTDTIVIDTEGFHLLDNGYIVAGPWHGYAFTSVSATGTTIIPSDFDTAAEDTPLCVSGTVAGVSNWSGSAVLSFNLNEDLDKNIGVVEPQQGGIQVDVTNTGGTELRVRIMGLSDNWCYVLKGGGPASIEWRAFNNYCWDNSGQYYEGEPLVSAGILVPGHNVNDRDYSFCLNSMVPFVDESIPFEQELDTEADTGEPLDTDLIPADWNTGFVGTHGDIKFEGSVLKDKDGNDLILRGLSLFWSQWSGKFYNADLVKWLVDDWKINILRASLGITENDGYLISPTAEMEKIFTVVNAAIENGIYVIIDWHAHDADKHPVDARVFFETMAKMYGDYPNVIYEVWNEPLAEDKWATVIKPYAEDIIEGIRKYDSDNLVIVGTRNWSQQVDEVYLHEIDDPNVAYTLHFYSGMHGALLRAYGNMALSQNIPIFITEWGVWEDGYINSDFNDEIDMVPFNEWMDWCNNNSLSMAMWSVNDKAEPSAILKPGASATGNWTAAELTTIGTYMHSLFNQ
ncbi:MAG: glycoside hydrolase family 5 protein [Deltaproteobacteria bacterium]|nr:glycoside hydrolase family 5 protein [Deltaproteobacteria bacterium]